MALPAVDPAPDHRPTLGLVHELFQDARQEKRKRIGTWNKYYRLTRNRSWSAHRESWLPSPSASEIFPTLHTLVAWCTDQRPRSFVSPSPDTLEFSRPPAADLITRLTGDMQQVLDSNAIIRDTQTQHQMALWDMFTFGAGILKTGWDPTLDFGQGDVVCRRVDPYAILPDPAASSMDDARYILEVRKVPLFEIKSRFGSRGNRAGETGASDDLDERPDITGDRELLSGNLASTGVTGAFPGVSTPGVPPRFGPVAHSPADYTTEVLLKECWVRNTRRVTIPALEDGRIVEKSWEVPYWEYIAEAGGVILNDDTTNPFEHGGCPYTRLPMVETGDFWSVPLVEHLAQAQIALNRLLAAMQLYAEMCGNPIFLEPENSGIARTKIVNRPGMRLTYNPGGGPPQWMTPPSMAREVFDLVGYWREEIDRISGISAVARGSSLRRREPAQAVDAVQEASFVRIRAVLRNLEEAIRRTANQTAANVVQFFLEPRTIAKVGPDGSDGYLQLGARHFQYPDMVAGKVEMVPLHFDVYMQAGSSLPISRQARAAEIDTLFTMGLVDPETVLTVHDVPDKARALEYAKQQQEAAAAAAAQKGKGGP